VRQLTDELGRRLMAPRYRYRLLAATGAVLLAAGVAVFALPRFQSSPQNEDISSQSRRGNRLYHPTDAEWASMTVEPVAQQFIGDTRMTEGKIAIDDERTTPIFSPYSGRVTKLLVKAGDVVERGQPLFVIEATETVQSLNDFMTAYGARNKARTQLELARTVEKRTRDLHGGNASPLRDLQQAQAELLNATNDLRAAETAFEAARNKLRLLGRSEDDIAAFQETGKVSADTTVTAPIAGTIVQRKIGPGQYISVGASDPAFVIGDLSSVWLIAYVRESDTSLITLGQNLKFTVQAIPGESYSARIDNVAAGLDPASRRMAVRAVVENPAGRLKPEMFANVEIATTPGSSTVVVPRSAVVFDGDKAGVWLVHDERAIELRQIRTGGADDKTLQVLEGLSPGDRIVTRGSIFTGGASTI
jgi:cobalt-zinc-cadmium efflux system membrane fusion protein